MEQPKTIFLIDDDPVVNYLHAKTLAKGGYTNTTAFERAAEALAFFESLTAPADDEKNLILLDLNMPVMDGWEFLDAFRSLPQAKTGGYAVVIVSSSIDPKDIERAQGYNVQRFISKPFTNDKLIALFQELYA